VRLQLCESLGLRFSWTRESYHWPSFPTLELYIPEFLVVRWIESSCNCFILPHLGDSSASLNAATRERDAEIRRLRDDNKRGKAEKETMLADSQVLIKVRKWTSMLSAPRSVGVIETVTPHVSSSHTPQLPTRWIASSQADEWIRSRSSLRAWKSGLSVIQYKSPWAACYVCYRRRSRLKSANSLPTLNRWRQRSHSYAHNNSKSWWCSTKNTNWRWGTAQPKSVKAQLPIGNVTHDCIWLFIWHKTVWCRRVWL